MSLVRDTLKSAQTLKALICLSGLILFFTCARAQDSLPSVDSLYLSGVFFKGAKKTKEPIMYREVTLKAGKWYPKDFLVGQLQRSRQNLMNTALFNFVDITQRVSRDSVEVTFNVTERWYIWPSPLFEFVDPNFNTWYQSKDLSRTSYGFLVTQYNFRGRNETLRLRAKFGYNEQYSLSYELPYIDKQKTVGVGLYLSYFQNYQVNTATEENKRVFYTIRGDVAREEASVGTRFTYRPAQYSRHFVSFKYNQVSVTDSIPMLFPDYLQHGLQRRKFVEIGYQFSYDKRDYSPYPLVGSYYTASVYKPDISVGNGKQDGLVQLYGQIKKYHDIGRNMFFAYSASAKYSIYKTLPYYFQRGLGYSDFVRGYEYYIVDAQHYAIVKTSLKYRLMKKREVKLGFIKSEKFNRLFFASYLNLNVDAAYAVDKLYQDKNPLANTLLLGGGIGLDLVSYYDIIIRGEYSLNKMGQPGFFLHFSRPI
ncbi:MAG: POTRA domain-containing protein [Bacteroidota bacterium]